MTLLGISMAPLFVPFSDVTLQSLLDSSKNFTVIFTSPPTFEMYLFIVCWLNVVNVATSGRYRVMAGVSSFLGTHALMIIHSIKDFLRWNLVVFSLVKIAH